MVIDLFPIDASRHIYSFRPQPNARPVKVEAPDGSVLRATLGLGLDLFVPSEGDELQLIRWNANAVMREAREGGRFRLVGSGKLARAMG